MALRHEKLDVYRTAIEYVGWAYRHCETLKEHRQAKGATPARIAGDGAEPCRG